MNAATADLERGRKDETYATTSTDPSGYMSIRPSRDPCRTFMRTISVPSSVTASVETAVLPSVRSHASLSIVAASGGFVPPASSIMLRSTLTSLSVPLYS